MMLNSKKSSPSSQLGTLFRLNIRQRGLFLLLTLTWATISLFMLSAAQATTGYTSRACEIMLDFDLNDELSSHLDNILNTSLYVTNRSLSEEAAKFIPSSNTIRRSYELEFGRPFVEEILKLQQNEHWVDMGAGEALAMLEYLIRSKGISAATTAINYATPPAYLYHWNSLETELTQKHRLIENQDFNELDLEIVGAADIVTDVYGVLAYTPHIDVALARALSLLKETGVLYMTATTTSFETDSSSGVFNLIGYLDRITGIKYEILNYGAIRIWRTGNQIIVPRLELIGFQSHRPPNRAYRILKNEFIKPKLVAP